MNSIAFDIENMDQEFKVSSHFLYFVSYLQFGINLFAICICRADNRDKAPFFEIQNRKTDL